MNRDELRTMISQGPVRVRMNNGDTIDIPHAEMALVGDESAAVLVRGENGRLVHRLVSLVAICTVENLSEATGA